MQTVHIERELPVTPDLAYEYFTDPERLTTWWPTEAETDPVVGGSYRMYWDGPDVTLRGKYRITDPSRCLAFTWKWDHEELPPRVVDILFNPTPRGTALSVTHDAGSDQEAADYTNGWIHFLDRLAAHLAASKGSLS